MNPVIDSLEREIWLLERGNLTWSSSTGRCETIKVIQEYVEPKQWPNYFDFLAEHKPFTAGINEHDAKLQRLNASANEVFKWMLSWDQFSETVGKLLDRYENQRASIWPQATSLTHSRNDLPTWSAENLINNIETLPSHYTISEFWKSAGENLRSFLGLPQFQPLNAAKNSLGSTAAVLKKALESRRLSLSREFDVPSAPVPGIWFDE